MLCPICDRQFEPSQSPALPFCSERCRSIDLGRWLGETYRMPVDTNAEALESLDDGDSDEKNDVAHKPS